MRRQQVHLHKVNMVFSSDEEIVIFLSFIIHQQLSARHYPAERPSGQL